MKTSAYHSMWALTCIGYGALFVLLPAFAVSLYGVATEPQILMMCRYFGTALLGHGMFRWSVRHNVDTSVTKSFVTADLIYCAILAAVTIFPLMSGTLGSFGWSTIALSIGFAFAAQSTWRANVGRFSPA